MKNEFDKKLTDRGWQSMRRTLDREMPEQRRRRRFGWWWFGAVLLLPLVGAGGWWLWQQSKPLPVAPVPVETPKVSKPVVEAEGTPRADRNNEIDSNASNGVASKSLRRYTAANFPNVADFSKNETYSSDEFKTGHYSSDGLEPSDELVTTAPELLPVRPNDPTGETFQKLTTFGKLESLPVLPQFVENENESKATLSLMTVVQPATIKKHSALKRWSLGLGAGVSSEKLTALNGFSAGAAVDWQFHRKWGLRAGLQYTQYRPSSEERPILTVDNQKYANVTGNFEVLQDGALPSNVTGDSAVLVPVERLRQLEMSLLAWWQPVRPLRIFAGVAPAYNLSAQASSQAYANNQFYYADDKIAKESLSALAVNALPRWQMNWQVGASARLGKHFEIGAFYKSKFPNLKNSPKTAFDAAQPHYNLVWQPRSAAARSSFILNGIWFF